MISLIQGPEGTSLEYTSEVMEKVDREYLDLPEVEGTFSLGGFGFSGNVVNSGITYVPLKPWGERKDPSNSAQSILQRVQGALAQISQARVIAFNLPTIQGLGNVGGFVFQMQDKGNNDISTFVKVKDELVQKLTNDLNYKMFSPLMLRCSSTVN